MKVFKKYKKFDELIGEKSEKKKKKKINEESSNYIVLVLVVKDNVVCDIIDNVELVKV